jgi:hypothetical protein
VAPYKKKKLYFTSKSRTNLKKQKRLFDEITETLRRARVLPAKTALPKFPDSLKIPQTHRLIQTKIWLYLLQCNYSRIRQPHTSCCRGTDEATALWRTYYCTTRGTFYEILLTSSGSLVGHNRQVFESDEPPEAKRERK